MRFKTSNLKEAKHTDLVSCVGWASPDDVISAGDDHKIYRWNLVSTETHLMTELSADFFPTDMQWFPRGGPQGGGAAGKLPTGAGPVKAGGANDVFLVTSAEGKLQLIQGKSGRLEKSVDAHRGACLTARWSHDGAGIATGGEDGSVKIWSRSGMLRSTLVQSSYPIYSLAWSSDSQAILYSSDRLLTIKSLIPNSKPLQWQAHEGIILSVDWSPSNGRIVSGAEDCRYRVWDSFGRQLYNSGQHDYPVTAVSWSSDGQMFAVGSFNTLRLCDKIGWSHSLDKPATGSIYKISWSSDGTQVACACGNGNVLFAHVVEKRLEWRDYEATVTGRKTISLRNVTNDAWEKLDFRDRIIQVSLSFDHLVVVTTAQCHIYTTKNWNTPAIFDLKEGSVSLIVQAAKHFLIAESRAVTLYGYDGRVLCGLKWPGMRPETLTALTVSVSPDTVAIRDQNDERVVHLFDATNGKTLNDGKPFSHRLDVIDVALDQTGHSTSRMLAFIDKNQDLFLTRLQFRPTTGGPMNMPQAAKLGSMVQSMEWNMDCNMLATIKESKFAVFLFPGIVYVDRGLLPMTLVERDASEFGKHPTLVGFAGHKVSVRRGDGSLLSHAVSPYPTSLHGYASSNRWTEALKLCRFVKDDTLWACLAGMAVNARQLETAETAYAEIHEADKVHYIQYIREQKSKEVRNAETAVLSGNYQDAENILLQAGYVFRAILLNIYLHQWEKALDLAVKKKTHVDTVLAYRIKHLNRSDKEEHIKKYVDYMKEVEIDWEQIAAKIEAEFERERRGEAPQP